MPVENLYATVEQLAPRAPSIITKDDAGEITDEARAAGELLLEAISRAIDSKTRRRPGAFSPAASEPSARVFYGNGKACLEVEPFVAGSVNPVVVVPAGFTAPKFVELKGLLCQASAAGVLDRSGRWLDTVPYTITARWGYAATPPDIREAALVWCALRAKVNAGDITGLVSSITRDGNTLMRDEVPPSVRDLLAPYVLPERLDQDDQQGIVEMGDITSSDDHSFDPFRREF